MLWTFFDPISTEMNELGFVFCNSSREYSVLIRLNSVWACANPSSLIILLNEFFELSLVYAENSFY